MAAKSTSARWMVAASFDPYAGIGLLGALGMLMFVGHRAVPASVPH